MRRLIGYMVLVAVIMLSSHVAEAVGYQMLYWPPVFSVSIIVGGEVLGLILMLLIIYPSKKNSRKE
ncbi:MAG TPA: hypothetical protein VLG69_02755 [Candidatus Andersenbacteria bacterium]|nr:hypothetical protein [Candidatus Andersenbacteria bacterium]